MKTTNIFRVIALAVCLTFACIGGVRADVSALSATPANGGSLPPEPRIGLAPHHAHRAETPSEALPDLPDSPGQSQLLRQQQHAVFMVGHPRGGFATAFLVHRKQRLLVTNAHVADMLHRHRQMYAIVNGTTSIYQVERAWYHPGLKRMIGNSPHLVARTMDPRDGSVARSPDIAVLQLSDEGADLPAALNLALPAEVTDLFAEEVSLIGFPGHSNQWPALGVAPRATFETGVINRATNFSLGGSERTDKRQFVQHSIKTAPGASGSPIFNRMGQVVAIHSSHRNWGSSQLFHAIRSDAVWETIAFHGLSEHFTQMDSTSINVKRFQTADPKLKRYRFIASTMLDVEKLLREESFAEAASMCNKLLAAEPGNPFAYYGRAQAFMGYADKWGGRLTLAKCREQYDNALVDIKRYLKAIPSNLSAQVYYVRIALNLAMLDERQGRKTAADRASRRLIAESSRLLGARGLSSNEYLQLYLARALAKQVVGDVRGGGADMDEAIQRFPNHVWAYQFRAQWRERTGQPKLAKSDREQARILLAAN